MGLRAPLLQHNTEVIFQIKKAYNQMHTKRFILYLLSLFSVQNPQDHESAFSVNLKHFESKPDHTLGKRYIVIHYQKVKLVLLISINLDPSQDIF